MNVLLLLMLISSVVAWKSEFVVNYLKYFQIKYCSLNLCWEKRSLVNIAANIFSKTNTRLAEMSKKTNFKFVEINFILDLSCSHSIGTFQQAIDQNAITSKTKWLILGESEESHRNSIVKYFGNLKLRMDSNIVIALKNRSDVNIYSVYNPGYDKGGSLVVDLRGTIQVGNFSNFGNIQTENFRGNMTGIVLKSGVVVFKNGSEANFEKYLLERRTDIKADILSKYSYSLFRHLIEIHNFSHTIRNYPKWFGETSTGEDSGMAKGLFDGEIDVSSTTAFPKYGRLKYFDFIHTKIFGFRSSFFFINPGNVGLLVDEYSTPFEPKLWYGILISGGTLSITLMLIYELDRKYYNIKVRYSACSVLLSSLGIFCQQGSFITPSALGGRIVFLSMLIQSIIFYNYYTSSIVSSLLSNKPSMPITLDELDKTNLKMGIEDAPYANTWLLRSNESDFVAIAKKVFPADGPPHYFDIETGISLVKIGGFAYHTECTGGYIEIKKKFDAVEVCQLGEVDLISKRYTSPVLPKDSQYKELFKVSYFKMLHSGIIDRHRQVWEERMPACSSNYVLAVGIHQVFLVFLFYFVCILVSVLVLGFERFLSKSNT